MNSSVYNNAAPKEGEGPLGNLLFFGSPVAWPMIDLVNIARGNKEVWRSRNWVPVLAVLGLLLYSAITFLVYTGYSGWAITAGILFSVVTIMRGIVEFILTLTR